MYQTIRFFKTVWRPNLIVIKEELMKIYLLIAFTLFTSLASGQRLNVVGEGFSHLSGDQTGYVCTQENRRETLREAWTKARKNAESQCGSPVRYLDTLNEGVRCDYYGISASATVEAKYMCLKGPWCDTPSRHCENGCCDQGTL